MKNNSIKVNFIMNVLLTLSSFVYPIITFPYVSRILTPVGTGKIAFATSYISYFLMLSQLGIPTYGIRACAQLRDNKQELSKTTHELFFINMIMCAVSYLILFGTIIFIPTVQNEKKLIATISLTIILNTIGMEWLYKGLELYSYITIRSVIFKAIAIVSMFLFVNTIEDYVKYGAITVLASSASFVLNFVHARKYVYFRILSGYNLKKHLRNILTFFAMAFATTIYTNLDAVMLGFMSTNADVGYYNAAVKIKTILVAVVSALGTVLLPRASYLIEHNQIEEFKKISEKAFKFVIMLSFPLMLYFVLFAKEGIVFLSGNAYYPSITPMQIIMPTVVIIGLTNIMGIQMLVPLRKEVVVLKSEIAGAITDLIMNTLLIPLYQATGAAIGTLVAEFVVLLVQYIHLRSDISAIFRNYNWIRLFLGLIFAVASSVWVKWIFNSVFVSLVVSGILFFAAYFGFMLLNKEEITYETFQHLKRKICRFP